MQPIVVWSGLVPSNKGRSGSYRLVLTSPGQAVIERCHADATGSPSWNRVEGNIPRGVITALAAELWLAKTCTEHDLPPGADPTYREAAGGGAQ